MTQVTRKSIYGNKCPKDDGLALAGRSLVSCDVTALRYTPSFTANGAKLPLVTVGNLTSVAIPRSDGAGAAPQMGEWMGDAHLGRAWDSVASQAKATSVSQSSPPSPVEG